MRFFYVHFPKAGGTSLRSQLEQNFPANAISDYDHNPLGGKNSKVKVDLPAHIIGVFGHLHPSRYFEWSNLMFTILRDPVANLVSIYYFWKDYPPSGNPVHDRFLKENPTLVEFAMRYPLRNLMSKVYFGNFDMERFQYIGFHEERDKTFADLSSLLGIPLHHGVHLNKTGEKHDRARAATERDGRTIARLRDALQKDLAFYENLRAKWA